MIATFEVLYVLFEHASGYAIFKVIANEEIGALLPEVQEAVHDLERFGKVVKLVAFSPFKSASHALENVNSISEGVVHEDLKVFIENNVPTGKKKSKVLLGISDSKLGASIQENVSICCESSGVVLEIIRGIRQHFHKMIEGLTAVGAGKAQLGLGHSYSRAKVKFNVHRADNMIIQTIALLDQLDKDINTFSMRIREWFSYHFPELIKIVSDNYMYAKVAKYIKSRKELTEDRLPGLEEIVMDEAKAKGIYDASKMSMGMDISPIDLVNIQTFADRVIDMADYRKKLHQYLLSKMDQVAPNLSAVIGELVGARLISHAGSLTNLAKYPASTVQILGAEKALFRALKTRGKTPKYGLIFHSSFIGRAGTKNKGRISRYLANKCSIASRIDCFSETPSPLFGKKLHEQVEDRLKFYETGETPKKNIDVMKEAMEELMKLDQSQTQEPEKKKKKKKKKKIKEEKENVDRNMIENGFDESLVNVEVKDEEEAEVSKRKKKAKKRKTEDAESSVVETTMLETTIEEVEEQPKKKAKKKKKTEGEISIFASSGLDTTVEAEEVPKKKKKKKDKKHEE